MYNHKRVPTRCGATSVSVGMVHPDTLSAGSNLALTCSNLGQLAEAEELQAEVLAASQQVRGSAHPDTLRVAAGLSLAYREQGREADAAELRTLYRL